MDMCGCTNTCGVVPQGGIVSVPLTCAEGKWGLWEEGEALGSISFVWLLKTSLDICKTDLRVTRD